MPIYFCKVNVEDHEQVRLVDAANPAGALKHMAKHHISVEAVRTSEDIKRAMEAKVEVEVAAAE